MSVSRATQTPHSQSTESLAEDLTAAQANVSSVSNHSEEKPKTNQTSFKKKILHRLSMFSSSELKLTDTEQLPPSETGITTEDQKEPQSNVRHQSTQTETQAESSEVQSEGATAAEPSTSSAQPLSPLAPSKERSFMRGWSFRRKNNKKPSRDSLLNFPSTESSHQAAKVVEKSIEVSPENAKSALEKILSIMGTHQNIFSTKGIFRIPGAQRQINLYLSNTDELCQKMQDSTFVSENIHIICSIIKKLISYSLTDDEKTLFLQSINSYSCEYQTIEQSASSMDKAALLETKLQLIPVHMCQLFDFLTAVAVQSDLNQMTLKNLVICLVPNFSQGMMLNDDQIPVLSRLEDPMQQMTAEINVTKSLTKSLTLFLTEYSMQKQKP